MDTTRWFHSLIGVSLLAHVGAACWIETWPQRVPEVVVRSVDQVLEVSFVELVEPEPEPEPLPEPPPPEPEPVPEPELEMIEDITPEPMVEPEPEPVTSPEPAPVMDPQLPVEPVVEPPPPAPVAIEEPMESTTIQEARPDDDSNAPPRYPRMARERGWQGSALLRVEVLTDGRAGKITILRSTGYRMLDEVSVEAVREWKFVPARRGNEAVRSWVEIPINFKLI